MDPIQGYCRGHAITALIMSIPVASVRMVAHVISLDALSAAVQHRPGRSLVASWTWGDGTYVSESRDLHFQGEGAYGLWMFL